MWANGQIQRIYQKSSHIYLKSNVSEVNILSISNMSSYSSSGLINQEALREQYPSFDEKGNFRRPLTDKEIQDLDKP
jgi:hypothetical protein